MTGLKIVLTAGHDRSLPTLYLAEGLRREGHAIAGILVATPYNLRRIRALIRSRGPAFLRQAAAKLLGRLHPEGDAPLREALAKAKVSLRSLKQWSRQQSAPYFRVEDLNAPAALQALETLDFDGVIYTGGGILKSPFLRAAKGRVLNAHMGPLPQIRGMNALEWSLLLDHPPSVTVHRIDRGVDTGPSVGRIPIPLPEGPLSLEGLRSLGVVMGMDALIRHAGCLINLEALTPDLEAEAHRQCFVLAPILRERLQARLSRRHGQ